MNTLLPVVLVAVLCVACSAEEDAVKIRALIDHGADLAEAHDISGILELAAADVRAMPMDLDRRGIKGVLWRAFRHYGPLTLLYPRPGVEIRDDVNQAAARFPFLIVKKGRTLPGLERLRDDPAAWLEAVGETADLYRLRLEMVRQDGGWRVKRAFLERFTGISFKE